MMSLRSGGNNAHIKRQVKMAVETSKAAEELKAVEDKAAKAKIDAENANRSGVGVRRTFGRTRGKGSQLVYWDEFDTSKPETLPKSLPEFHTAAGKPDDATLLSYLIDGYNAQAQNGAQDPIGEFVDSSWSPEKQSQFRLVVRNYAKMLNVSIEDAAQLFLSKMK